MAPTSRNRVMLASSKRLYGPPSTNYTDVSRAVARRLRLAPRDHDVAAEGAQRERRAAVAERAAHRSAAHAAAAAVAIAAAAGAGAAANGERDVRADAAAEGVRRQLEAGRVREHEANGAGVHVDVVDAAAREATRVLEAAAHRLRAQALAADIGEHDVAAHRSEIEAARLDVARVHRAADAANRQVAVGRDPFERDVAGDRLRRFDVRRAARDDVAADALGAHRAANAGRLHVARDRFQLDRRARRNDDGIVDRHVVVSVAAVLLVLRADVHAPRPLVDDDADVGEAALIAARALGRLD